MWKETLGIEVKLVNQEWKVYLTTIKGADTPQIYRLGWCLDYADANNFIYEVFALGGSANPSDVVKLPPVVLAGTSLIRCTRLSKPRWLKLPKSSILPTR